VLGSAVLMATMVTEVYDTLRDVGVSEEKARAAAVAMAMREPRFAGLDSRLGLLTRMVGFNLALTAAILWKVFSH
jgi:hypothetical protein